MAIIYQDKLDELKQSVEQPVGISGRFVVPGLEELEKVGQTFDAALESDLGILRWFRSALPLADDTVCGPVINWREVSKRLKEAGHEPLSFDEVLASDTSAEFASKVIGRMIFCIDKSKSGRLDNRGCGLIDRAIAGLDANSPESEAWTESLGASAGRAR